MTAHPAPDRYDRRGLRELAPRFKLIAERRPRYVRSLEAWVERARAYADESIRPRAMALDQRCSRDPGHFDWDLVREATPYGLLSMMVPRGAGGGDAHTTALALVMEELCAACSGVANIIGAHGLGLSGILLGFDLYHLDRAVAEMCRAERRGEPLLFAAAITEPTAGSDVEDAAYLRTARLVTEAKKVSGGYRLNGRKVFISNGSVARYINVIAPLDRAHPVESLTSFLVRSDDPGFAVGRIEEKMGMKACPATELVFDDCFVPGDRRIGAEGEGMRGVETVLGASRGPVGAIATGIARGALERVVAWARQRGPSGRRPIDDQHVQHRLADLARRIHLARQAYLDSCLSFDFQGVVRLTRSAGVRALLEGVPQRVRRHRWLAPLLRSQPLGRAQRALMRAALDDDDQHHIQTYASIAKVSASDIAVEVAYEALQLVGLEAALARLELEKIYRDAKLTQIYEGTNQLNRHNIFVHHFDRERAHAR